MAASGKVSNEKVVEEFLAGRDARSATMRCFSNVILSYELEIGWREESGIRILDPEGRSTTTQKHINLLERLVRKANEERG